MHASRALANTGDETIFRKYSVASVHLILGSKSVVYVLLMHALLMQLISSSMHRSDVLAYVCAGSQIPSQMLNSLEVDV